MKGDIINVLNKIEENGFEAYVIGGYVRDKLLGIESFDIDIATNAKPKDLITIFNVSSSRTNLYGTTKITTNKYRFDIATYRKELSYNGRKPETIEYINKIDEDILRRDFTINTIAMNSKGDIIDKVGGMKDLQSKLIRCVGDANLKFKEDPLRMLRALRFSFVLDFKLESNLVNALKKNLKLIKTLSNDRIKEEFSKILSSQNAVAGIDYMNKLGLLKLLNISYDNLVYVDDIIGMYAQLNMFEEYPFTKEEKNNINLIKNIIKSGKINNLTLYNNGLYICLVAGKIFGIDREEITAMYNDLPIKSRKDLDITYDEIIKVLNIKPSSVIQKIYNDIINNIMLGELENKKEDIISYIINNKEVYLNEL